jgi:hypothetical protein
MSQNEIDEIRETIEGVIAGRLIEHAGSKLVSAPGGRVVRIGRREPRIGRDAIRRITEQVGEYTAQQLREVVR